MSTRGSPHGSTLQPEWADVTWSLQVLTAAYRKNSHFRIHLHKTIASTIPSTMNERGLPRTLISGHLNDRSHFPPARRQPAYNWAADLCVAQVFRDFQAQTFTNTNWVTHL